jgi:hypothetical protein
VCARSIDCLDETMTKADTRTAVITKLRDNLKPVELEQDIGQDEEGYAGGVAQGRASMGFR